MRFQLALLAMLLALFAAAPVWSQSSGNFAATINTTQCTIDNNDGSLVGGITVTSLTTTIKTPNSSQTALLIRPSFVTGLYTKNKVTFAVTPDTAWASMRVRVCLDDQIVAPGTPVGGSCSGNPDSGWIYYDKRWVQVNQFFLNAISGCMGPPCNLELIISTLSAHSFDFVAPDVGGGTHTVTVEWSFDDQGDQAGDSAACVGPGVLTVTQVKTFSTGGGIVISP